MFASKKLVWFKDLNFLNLSQTGKSEGAQKQGQHFQEALLRFDPKIVDVLVTACPIDRRNRTVKWLEKEAPADYQTVGAVRDEQARLLYCALITARADEAGRNYSLQISSCESTQSDRPRPSKCVRSLARTQYLALLDRKSVV